jgi:hypothetical protein
MLDARSGPLFDRRATDSLIGAVAASINLASGRSALERFERSVERDISAPVGRYLEHVHWPSRLTAYGLPLELSLALDGTGETAFRFVTDPSDHRFWLAENWNEYLHVASASTGLPRDTLNNLFVSHLAVNPPTTRSPIYIGNGYGSGGWHRGSIYFFIGGISRDGFEQRFASDVAIIDASLLSGGGKRPDPYHGVAYDYDASRTAYRTKYYAWLDRTGNISNLHDVLGNQPDLVAAQELMDYLRTCIAKTRETRSTLLQSSVSRSNCSQKIFLNAHAWSFDRPDGFRAVIDHLLHEFTVDLSPLLAVLDIFSKRGIPLLPLWLAVGGPLSAPSITFYFEPIMDRALSSGVGTGESLAGVEQALHNGLRYLLECQLPDGGWPALPNGAADEAMTAQVALSAAHAPQAHEALQPTARWLSARSTKPAPQGCPERASASLLVLALLRLGFPVTHSSENGLWTGGPPEYIAAAMLAGLETNNWSERQVEEALNSLHRSERWSGGWSGVADDLYVTVRVAEALALVVRSGLTQRTCALEMKARTAYYFIERPVAAEPAKVALWLKGWLLCENDLRHASVDRAIAFLDKSQESNGKWLPTPFQKADGSSAHFDPLGFVTTAMVVETLALLLGRLTT